MKWISSRGASPAVPFIDALFAGTAPDGGLYMPERLDPLPPAQLDAIRPPTGTSSTSGRSSARTSCATKSRRRT